MSYLTGAAFERKYYDRKKRESALRAQGAMTDPQTLDRILGINRNWPGLKPGAVVGLAQAGLDAYAPEVKEAAKLSFDRQRNENQWKVNFKDYDEEAIAEQEEAKKPDPQFVLRALLPRWNELMEKQSKNEDTNEWSDKELAEFKQLQAGLKYAALNYNDKQLSSIARQMDIKPKMRENLRGLASQARTEHELTGSGDISNAPYLGPVLRNVVKPVVSEATLAGMAPLEALQGAFRNAVSAANKGDFFIDQDPEVSVIEQTQLHTQVKGLFEGTTTDIGDGFLPAVDSPVAEKTAELQRQAAPTIGGHAWSVGRGIANEFWEPDTLPFQVTSGIVDAGVAYKLDPASLALGVLGDVRQANKRFAPLIGDVQVNAERFSPEIQAVSEATGVLPTSSRAMVNQRTKTNFLMGDKARRDAETLLGNFKGNPSGMMRAINNSNKASPLYPIETIHGEKLIEQLADAETADDFLDVVGRTSQVQTPFRAPGVSYHVKQAMDYRIFAAMPRGSIDLTDKNKAWKQLDDTMRAFSVPTAQRDVALNKYIRSGSQFAGINAIQDTITNNLVYKFGTDRKAAEQYASFFADAHKTDRVYAVDQMTGEAYLRGGVSIAGKGHKLDSPRLITEGLMSPVQIPDLRAARRIASDLNAITATEAWKTGQKILRAPQAVWAPLQILSFRQATRDFAETQVNLMARGGINWFTDPIQSAGMIIGAEPNSKLGRWLEKIPGVEGRYLFDAQGQSLIAETDDLLMHSMLAFTDPDTIATRGFRTVYPKHADAAEGFAEELGRMNGDPVMRYIAGARDPAEAKAWFWADDVGKEHRLARAPSLQKIDESRMARVATGELTEHIAHGDIANNRVDADRFIDELYLSLEDQTRGSLELLDAVRDGQLGGGALIKSARSVRGEDLSTTSEGAIKRARELLDEGYGPQRDIKVREKLKKVPTDYDSGKELSSKALETLFHGLVDVPDKVLNRNMTWQQLQWKAKIENAHMLSADDLGALREAAKKANISKAQMRQLGLVKTDVSAQRRFTIPELDKISKYQAADEMTAIVHDLKSRSQFFDMVKFMIPFGDAFRLVMTRMVKLAHDEPQVLRRATQAIMGARQEESGTVNRLLGDPVPAGQPFFHDDEFGEEVAIIPGSSVFNEAVYKFTHEVPGVKQVFGALESVPLIGEVGGGNGIPLPMVSHVTGWKMVGDMMPGFGGPATSFPAKWLLPQGALPEQVRDVMFPYGGDESQGIGQDIISGFIPKSWLRMLEGPSDQRGLAREVNNQIPILMNSGEYDQSDPRDLARLADDARSNAIWVERFLKGFGSFTQPGYPSLEANITDKSGRIIPLFEVQKMVRRHSEKKDGTYDPDKGTEWFLKRFGRDNIFALSPANRATGYAAPISRKGREWSDAHPEVKEAGNLVYGYFTGEGENPKDIDNWARLISEGEVEPLTAEEQIAKGQDTLGWYLYDKAIDKIIKDNGGLPLDDGQWEWVREDLKPDIKKDLPGWNSYLANPFDNKKKRDSAIAQLQAVAKLPSVKNTDAGQGLIQYLESRDKGIKAAKQEGWASPFQAKNADYLRDYLRGDAEDFIAEHPAFRPIWEQIFKYEMVED